MSRSKLVSRRSVLGYMGVAGSLAAMTPLGMCGTSGQRESGKLVLATVKEAGQYDSDAFFRAQMKRFTEQTDIEVELRTYPIDQYANSIQLLFSQNSPPDVFRSAGTEIAHPVPYVRGWEASLQDYVTDEFAKRWPEGSFEPKISGLHVGDELYATPYGSNGPIFPLLCNVQLLERYGIDEPPRTWGAFEDAAAKISKDSKGKVRGFYPLVHFMLAAMQATAGPDLMASGGDIKQGGSALNLRTGKSEASSEQLVSLAKLLQRMSAADGFIRGWEGAQAQAEPAFWKAMAQDRVAMGIGSNWHYREILRLREDLPLSIEPVPVPDGGRKGYQTKAYVFLPFWHLSAKSKKQEEAWQLIDFMGKPEFILAGYKLARRNPPAFPLEEFEDITDKWDRRMLEVKKETMRFAPTPTMKTIDAAAVQGEIQSRAPSPSIVEMFAEALSKPGSYDYASNAESYDEKNTKNIEEQIAKAQDDGKDVDEKTFTFPDWDPLEDYAPQGVTVPRWS